MSWLRHHEFVAVGVDAHGEVERIFGGVVGFAGEVAAVGFEFGDGRAEVFDLKGEAGPGALAFAAAVNADDAVGDLNFRPDFGFHGDSAVEEVAVEGDGALPVGGPEGVFCFGDGHLLIGKTKNEEGKNEKVVFEWRVWGL